MTPERMQRAYELFERALERPPGERAALLTDACGDDAELRAEVNSLLEHDQLAAAGFLRPAKAGPGPQQANPPDITETVEDAEPPEPAPTAPQVEGYDIVRELGRGGQAVVYQAIQKPTKRKVAIKILLEGPYASKPAQRRFEREIELVAQLKHPNIISIFHSGTTSDGRQFYVMDYVRGTPLHHYVREQKLTLEETLRLFAGVCEAVQHAHQKGMIHRDLKPTNILVDGEGSPKIMDFGLAKWLHGPVEAVVSMTEQVIGTLPYMSPEQARGNPDMIDTRTDVYALGVILYELLTGHYPYPVVGQVMEVLKHITETPPTPPSRQWSPDSGIAKRSARKLRAGQCPIDDEVQTIVLRALAKERVRRYQSAGELGRDIGHYLTGEPIEAKRDSALYVLKKLLRHYRTTVTTAATVTITLIIAGVLISEYRQALVEQRQKTSELQHLDAANALLRWLRANPEHTAGDEEVARHRPTFGAVCERLRRERATSLDCQVFLQAYLLYAGISCRPLFTYDDISSLVLSVAVDNDWHNLGQQLGITVTDQLYLDNKPLPPLLSHSTVLFPRFLEPGKAGILEEPVLSGIDHGVHSIHGSLRFEVVLAQPHTDRSAWLASNAQTTRDFVPIPGAVVELPIDECVFTVLSRYPDGFPARIDATLLDSGFLDNLEIHVTLSQDRGLLVELASSGPEAVVATQVEVMVPNWNWAQSFDFVVEPWQVMGEHFAFGLTSVGTASGEVLVDEDGRRRFKWGFHLQVDRNIAELSIPATATVTISSSDRVARHIQCSAFLDIHVERTVPVEDHR